MAPAETQPVETESDRIERWRYHLLERAGFPAELARELAASGQVDLHGAISLLERGCDPVLAAEILL